MVFLLNDRENTIEIQAGLILALSGLGYILFNFLNVKNIEKLSRDKRNYIADLIKKI